MNEKAIFEIGDIIHVRWKNIILRQRFTPKELTKTYEYKQFKKFNPELCRLAEK